MEEKMTAWVARDFGGLCLFSDKPNWSDKEKIWFGHPLLPLTPSMFRELRASAEPVEVEITIKSK